MGKIDNKLLYQLIPGFFVAAIIATAVHEYGHFFTAKLLGYEARMSHGYTTWKNTVYLDFIDSLTREERMKIRTNKYFARKDEYTAWLKRIEDERFLITRGGPLRTIIMGTAGFVLALRKRKGVN